MREPVSRHVSEELRKHLVDKVCSSAWLDTLCGDPDDPEKCWADPDAYPAEMRECPSCGRISPPNDAGPVCSDCKIESEEADFLERLKRSGGDRTADICSLRWRRIAWCQVIGEGYVRPLLESRGTNSDDGDGISPSQSLGDAEGAPSAPRAVKDVDLAAKIHRHLGISTPHVRLRDPTSLGNLRRLPAKVASALADILAAHDGQILESLAPFLAEIREACKPLSDIEVVSSGESVLLHCKDVVAHLIRYEPDVPRRNRSSARAVGCRLQMLSEEDKALSAEIAYFQKKGRILPSSKRFTLANPF